MSADAFVVGCWNGEKVPVVFALDCCDREAMGFTASTCGISDSMARDLMLECVEKRFGTSRVPHRAEWLTDNGSCFAANETVEFTSWLGLVSRLTPARSPESSSASQQLRVSGLARTTPQSARRPEQDGKCPGNHGPPTNGPYSTCQNNYSIFNSLLGAHLFPWPNCFGRTPLLNAKRRLAWFEIVRLYVLESGRI